MSKLVWDQTGEKYYETGVDRGVVYPKDGSGAYPEGFAWNGLTAVNESPSGAESTPLYADNAKYLELTSAEEFGGTIEAYTYPDEFAACDGSADLVKGVSAMQQDRQHFGFCYRTLVGNDTTGTKHGYKIHLVYDAVAKPSSRDNSTVNDSPEAVTMSWEFSTTPVTIKADGFKPTAHLIVNSTKLSPAKLSKLEDILYGSESAKARLPLPDEIISLVNAVSDSSDSDSTGE